MKQEHIKTQLQHGKIEKTSYENALYIPEDASLKDVYDLYLKKLLKEHSLSEVVKISGISRTTLWRYINKLDLNK